MNDLIGLALSLLVSGAERKGQHASRCTALVVAGALAAAFCAAGSVACGLAALWIAVLPRVGAAGAPAIVSAVLLAMCVAVLGFGRYKFKPRPVPPRDANALLLLTEAARLFKEHKGAVLMAALLAGLVAGKNEK